MAKSKLTFPDIFFSWGSSIIVLIAVIITFIGWVNGSIGSGAEFFTELGFNLIYLAVYIILRMIPSIDERPSFYPQKPE